MASSSKSINMPLMFAISIGATVSLIATVMFALAWYQYEARVVLRDQVINTPMHDQAYDRELQAQLANLSKIEEAMDAVAAEQAGPAHGQGHDVGQPTAPTAP